jgi:phosphoglycolate phosphatase-like HAD superfamily hydrolase
MDGVLFSSEGFIAKAYEEAIIRADLNLPLPTAEHIIHQVGKPIIEIFRNLFPQITAEEIAILHKETLVSVVNMINKGKGYMYDDIPLVIKSLSAKYKLFICSNGRKKYIESVLSYYKLDNCFDPVVTLEDLLINNKGELLKAIMNDSKAKAENWVMIGDRRSDYNAALYAGVKFIGCLWGHGDKDEIKDADMLLKEPKELLKVF